MRITGAALFAAAIALVSAGCSDSAGAVSDAAADAAGEIDGGAPEPDLGDGHGHGHGALGYHIHSIQFYGDTREVVVGTHEGVHRTVPGGKDLVAVHDSGDFMGFVQDPSTPDTYWGSGHWAAGGFNNWGFIESTDRGATWKEISLTKVADFHKMAVSPDKKGLVVGAWNRRVYVSVDSGRSWDSYVWSAPVSGMVVEDPDGPVLLMASSAGIERLTLPAGKVATVVSADVTGVALQGAGLIYGTSDAKVSMCDRDGGGCTKVAGPSGAPVQQFLVDPADRNRIHALTTTSQVYHTDDSGKTWELLISGS